MFERIRKWHVEQKNVMCNLWIIENLESGIIMIHAYRAFFISISYSEWIPKMKEFGIISLFFFYKIPVTLQLQLGIRDPCQLLYP